METSLFDRAYDIYTQLFTGRMPMSRPTNSVMLTPSLYKKASMTLCTPRRTLRVHCTCRIHDVRRGVDSRLQQPRVWTVCRHSRVWRRAGRCTEQDAFRQGSHHSDLRQRHRPVWSHRRYHHGASSLCLSYISDILSHWIGMICSSIKNRSNLNFE